MKNTRKFDLITNSTLLQEAMLSEFPFPLFPEQYHVCRAPNRIVIAHFKDLKKREIISYLNYKEAELSDRDCYEVRDSLTGDYFRLRMNGRIITDREKIQSYLQARLLPGRLN